MTQKNKNYNLILFINSTKGDKGESSKGHKGEPGKLILLNISNISFHAYFMLYYNSHFNRYTMKYI